MVLVMHNNKKIECKFGYECGNDLQEHCDTCKMDKVFKEYDKKNID